MQQVLQRLPAVHPHVRFKAPSMALLKPGAWAVSLLRHVGLDNLSRGAEGPTMDYQFEGNKPTTVWQACLSMTSLESPYIDTPYVDREP